ncbi:hypothetical protein C3B44_06590 [Corynebacterium yudongzhengii]|uniref:Mechanosensitive ion channel family protein n=1 Tax=Corynebacterium yudongzhengii TaxID=2080740 RepID=A0A2U1T971_9CORY|nr:mechanosensitive ion channel family protein [Corynebacterium yudongzhengii]AWB82060.1 hypothetical protein C3B44_06590 [Corynebacterium yudongzhengii]PWC02564.1 mechanosensitive ion channel family protein [Corynebacterium yudongzhengii]
MPIMYFLDQLWAWVANTGINLAIIVVLALLVPRIGRFAERVVEREIASRQNDDESKASLAIAGVGIYVAQVVVYFLLALAFLSELGFSLAGAAIPATVVSAAVGFGAQSIIADFLAGFFILSEKQYGVGDWVRFQGNGIDVEGSVISITMRTTTIRTLAQETVTIPNSTARVCINTSNYWSRAVIVMPIPLLGSESAANAVKRAESATRSALERSEITDHLIGELDVQPATAVTPPSTVGMPWTMDVRLMIQVHAGEQWAVERAVRLAILEEFWDEYGSATTASGLLRDELAEELPPQPVRPASSKHKAKESAASAADTPTEVHDPVTADAGSRDEGDNPVPTHLSQPDGSDPAAERLGDDTEDDDPEDTEEAEERPNRRQRIMTLVRETRGSTFWMLGVLGLLLVAKLLFFSTEGADGERIAGILAPPVRDSAEQTTEETPTGEAVETEEPVNTPSQAPQDSDTNQAPGSATNQAPEDSSQGGTEQNSQSGSQADSSTGGQSGGQSGQSGQSGNQGSGNQSGQSPNTVEPQSAEQETQPATPEESEPTAVN